MKKLIHIKVSLVLLLAGCSSQKAARLSAPIVSSAPRVDTASFSQNIVHLEETLGNTNARAVRIKTLIDNIKVD